MKKSILILTVLISTVIFAGCTAEPQQSPVVSNEAPICTEHKIMLDFGKQPTCTEEGLTDGRHCYVCGEILQKQETIPAIGHNIVDGVCQTCGYQTFSVGINYELSEDGSYYIVRDNGSCTDEAIVLKSNIDGIPVREIGREAFAGLNAVSFSIPSTVEKIGENAFRGCTKTETVYIDDLDAWCVTEFENENSNPLKYANDLYIKGKKLSGELYITEQVGSVSKYAFAGLSSFSTLRIAYGVTSIEDSAFENCKGIETLDVSKTVRYIGESAFSGCNKIRNINIHDVETWLLYEHSFDSWYMLYCNEVLLKEVTVQNKISRLLPNAFAGCRSIETVSLGLNCETIGDNAFAGCTGLTEIQLSSKMKSIGADAFYGCTSLTKISIPVGVSEIGERAFGNCKSLEKLALPESIIDIPNELFINCEGLYSISISLNARSIGERTFMNCLNLNSVFLPDTLESIGREAFAFCESLQKITIPNRVKKIEARTFFSSGIQSLYLGNGVSEIGSNAFARCQNLTAVRIGTSLRQITNQPFALDKNIAEVVVADITQWSDMVFVGEYANPLDFGGMLFYEDEREAY